MKINNNTRGYCNICHKRTTHKNNDGEFCCIYCEYKMLEDKLTSSDAYLLKIAKASNLEPEELKIVLQGTKVLKSTGRPYSVKGKTITFGVFGDSHIGHQSFDGRLMDFAIDVFNKRKVDFVVHTGDVCEGHYENKRQGSVLELTHIGGDAQVKEAVRYLSRLQRPLYFVTGNHETNTFYKMGGFDIGLQLKEKLPGSRYLGIQHGIINLNDGKKIQIIHPDGGTAYALSYKSQKIAESLEGGTKPDILLIGHFHKAEYLFYRNIHILQTATLQSQTPFMKNNHISAHKGFYIVTATIGKAGVSKIIPEFFPAY
jgi:predicted phosphodiesterase